MPKQYGFGENRRNLPIEPIEPMPTFDIREEQFLEKKPVLFAIPNGCVSKTKHFNQIIYFLFQF